MIQPLAIPPIAIAAIMSYVGGLHLVVWLRTRRGRIDLTFALTCFCTALYAVTCAGLYNATSLEEGLPWSRLQRFALGLDGAVFAWFVADYTRRLSKRLLHGLTIFGLGFALSMVLAPHWTLSGEPNIKMVSYPWPATYYEMGVRPIGFLFEAWGVALFVASFGAALRQLRAGEGSRARPLLIALAVLATGVINDIGVAANVLPTNYIIEYCFLGLVVLMAYSLMNEVLRAEHAESVVRETGAHFRMLSAAIEQTGEVVIVTDAQGTIEYVNPAFEQVTGFSRAETIGHSPSILKSGEHSADFYRELWDTITSGQSWRGQLTNRRKNGSLFTEDAVISPVRDDAGRLIHFVGVKRDISAQVHLQERLRQGEKLEAIGLLAGGVAHDFNNLLTPILGYADLLEQLSAAGDPNHEMLGEIRRAALDAQRLTQQLLAFGHKQAIEPQVVDLGELTARASGMLRRAIRENVEIEITRGEEPSLVKADLQQIEQVLMNLAINAQDAMPDGGSMRIETSTALLSDRDLPEGAQSGAYAVLAVADTGIGMDAETQARLFEPFFTSKESGRGTGLGLATAYGIVKQHGGWIGVASEPGHGSRFEVHLPRTLEIASQTPPRPTPAAREGRETILVVEDDDLVRKLTRDLLRAQGYAVLTAECGSAALARAEAFDGPIHLLLTDVIMPGMSGRELSERVASARPDMRVLFMSGHSQDVIAPQGILDGRVELIAKPFSVDALANKVREVLDR